MRLETDDAMRARLKAVAGVGTVNDEKIATAEGLALDEVAAMYGVGRLEFPEESEEPVGRMEQFRSDAANQAGSDEFVAQEPSAAAPAESLDDRYVTRQEYNVLLAKLRHWIG